MTFLTLLAAGAELHVELRAPEIAAAAAALLPGAAGGTEGEPDLVLEATPEGFELHVDGGRWWASEASAILTRLELCAAEALAARSGHVTLHAGGVVLGDGAVLLAGESGSGKSSLTAGLAARGRAVLGDDAVLMEEGGRVHALRRRLKVEEPARSLLALPEPSGPLAGLWPDVSLYAPEELGSRWAEPCAVRAVVFPERTEGRRSLTPLEPPEGLRRALSHVLLEAEISARVFASVAEALEEAGFYRLEFDESAGAVEALEAALG